ncbi:hypothetical protein BV22DRAFT_1007452 [Leucogyrophana mollusca]|uniref:Uncharacterized protein n=1 Tax=Leucogyrophana mollusca TaxID=85980 RepID=A0ACB8BPW9_9AGAM|nr:hypothetical protein BV22DRAFT_1007452 [Leucogyrophana mollusca]
MDSSSHRAEEEKQKQLEIRKQIKLLQAQLSALPEDALLESPKRARVEPTLLAPATPSPKKKRKVEHSGTRHDSHSLGIAFCGSGTKRQLAHSASAPPTAHAPPPKPAPSNVLSKLAESSTRAGHHASVDLSTRSLTLADKAKPKAPSAAEPSSSTSTSYNVPQRDDRLAIIEEMPIGPADHKPPLDDPLFERLEPNSGIRLLSRTLSHDDLQEHIRGRYYISPSRLYSSIRLLPSKQGYDVPVDGDWITIAVVAERGPVRYSRAPVDLAPGDDGCASDEEPTTSGSYPVQKAEGSRQKGKPVGETRRPSGKKYVNMKLIDFGARTSSSATGGKAAIRGDAFLSLLLFESDGFDRVKEDDGTVKKIYKGGSRGAFEAMSKLKEGDVIALLNPKVLKPFQRSNDNPHPTNNILAVTPEAAGSIEIIGRAKDLGMCKAVKRDGKPCGSWCDKRESDVCEWHLQSAVQRQRAGRAEFSIGTSGMSSSSTRKRKPEYDPARQWGLKPTDSDPSGNATYIVSGHIVGKSTTSVAETMGREGQAKAARKSGKDADRELKSLLDRDKEGMRAVVKAREVATKMEELSRASTDKSKRIGKGKSKTHNRPDNEDISSQEPASSSAAAPTKMAYSAQIIKNLGFDPAAKTGQKRADDAVMQRKLQALAAVQSSRKNINLAPRPGAKIRSGVSVPSYALDTTEEGGDDGINPNFDNPDRGSDIGESKADAMVDLDGSDI